MALPKWVSGTFLSADFGVELPMSSPHLVIAMYSSISGTDSVLERSIAFA